MSRRRANSASISWPRAWPLMGADYRLDWGQSLIMRHRLGCAKGGQLGRSANLSAPLYRRPPNTGAVCASKPPLQPVPSPRGPANPFGGGRQVTRASEAASMASHLNTHFVAAQFGCWLPVASSVQLSSVRLSSVQLGAAWAQN